MTRANQPPHYEDDERLDWLDGDWDRIDAVREALDEQPEGTNIRFVIDCLMLDDPAFEGLRSV